mmetsp:Transcript_5131/g.14093  ORF Transcript_5131/g.14093 Transcript_5131/m.14093 type:complete len:201 (+) Transcript_5131:1858-2460(+)
MVREGLVRCTVRARWCSATPSTAAGHASMPFRRRDSPHWHITVRCRRSSERPTSRPSDTARCPTSCAPTLPPGVWTSRRWTRWSCLTSHSTPSTSFIGPVAQAALAARARSSACCRGETECSPRVCRGRSVWGGPCPTCHPLGRTTRRGGGSNNSAKLAALASARPRGTSHAPRNSSTAPGGADTHHQSHWVSTRLVQMR